MRTLTRKVWTDAALMALPRGQGKYELIDGELTHMSPTGYRHGQIELFIGSAILNFVKAGRLGLAYGPSTGFRLDPDNVLSPDVSYASRAWIEKSSTQPEGFFQGAPELAVEVISPSERKSQIRLKIEKYFAHDTRVVWLVYPRRKTVEIFTSPDEVTTLTGGELDGGDVLPSFRLSLDEIFAEWF